ncbi:twin-arginine translocase TatA/TatE family subunit [Dehalobacter sp. DCM]|nr:twin-arginine translocase TatA/TatE family subunit [Dehalobacter sp. DCM]
MISPWAIVVVLVIVLIIFGPGKLPELGKAMGKGIKEFKEATTDEDAAKPASKDSVEEKKES